MMQAPIQPENEAARVIALQKLRLLDTEAEERFDRITRLATQLFSVPIAVISLVDEQRQWFKSRQGLNACETSRDISFCGHTILDDGILEITDASRDSRFVNNPLVTGTPHIRFYAGVPLTTLDGYRIGTLCLIDNKQRQLTASERRSLRDLADCVEVEINQLVLQEQSRLLKQTQQLSKVITRAQSQFIREHEQRSSVFDGLLEDILELTESEWGLIGEVLYNEEGLPYLKTYNITNIAWDDTTLALYKEKAVEGMEFTNLNTLFGTTITSGEPVIVNAPDLDLRSCDLLEGHLTMNAFLSIPVHFSNELVAMLVIANRPGGYDQALLDFMHPLTTTLGQLVEATRIKQRHRQDEHRLAMVIEGTNIGTWEWNVQTGETIFNTRWAEIVGYTLTELQPISIQTWLDLAHPEDLKQSAMLLERHFSGELDYYDAKCRMRHKLGYWVWVHDCGRVMSWTVEGKPLLMSGTHADITEQIAMNEAIDQQRWLYEHILEQSLAGYWDWMLQQDTEYLSPSFKRMFGYDEHEMINSPQSWQEIIFQEDLPGVLECFDQHINSHGQVPFDNTVRYHHKNGSTVWVRCLGKVIEWGQDGKPVRMIGCHIDITDLKQSEQALKLSESRLRGLFELSPIGIALNEFDTGRFVDINDALLVPTGYTREEFVALSYMDLTPKEYGPLEVQHLESMEKTGHFGPYEKEYIRKDGSRYPVLLNGMVVYDPSGRKLIWSMVEDISERKRIERIKNEFISTVSHELRTPLTSITGALGLLKGGVVGELPEPMRDMLDIAHKNSQRLVHLINDLLDMEKLMAGKLRFDLQVQQLMPLVDGAIRDNHSYAEQYGVRLEITERADGALVEVDSQRLQQVLANLLSNAAKFSPQGGVVEVRTTLCGEQVRVAVIDQGDGIPYAFRDQIFQKFSQADASDTRQKGGSGLGLAISRELMEHMGGSIGFDSVEGAGTKFWFELPLISSVGRAIPSDLLNGIDQDAPDIVVGSAKMVQGRLAINGDFSGIDWLSKPVHQNHLLSVVERQLAMSIVLEPRVLHVEDDADLHQVIRTMVGKRFVFELATTLAEARARLMLERFDVIILDLGLPDGSGWDLLPIIRSRQSEARVIILSGTEITAEEVRKVEAVLLKSKVSSRELFDAISVRLQSFNSKGKLT